MDRGRPGVIVRVDNIFTAGFSRPVEGDIRHLCVLAIFASVQTIAVSAEQITGELTRFIRTIVRAQQGDVFAVAAATDLSFSQMRALCLLEAADHELALTELAPLLGLSPAATGRALDALAAQGYVDRRPDAGDRRIKRLALSAAGRETARRVTTAKHEALLRFAETLSDAERHQLSRALAPILARADALNPQETP
jgi:DNA-binding MarR family transcriptional regulator